MQKQVLEGKHRLMLEPNRQSTDSLLLQQQWVGRSLQDISEKGIPVESIDESRVKIRLDYRNSMPNIQQESRNPPVNHHHKQPPLVQTNKLTHFNESLTVNKSVKC